MAQPVDNSGTQGLSVFALQCPNCGKLFYPSVLICGSCHARRDPLGGSVPEWKRVSLEEPSTLLSWTRVYALPDGFMLPYLDFCIVEFPNGLRASGRLRAENPDFGMRLTSRVEAFEERKGAGHYGFVFAEEIGAPV